MDPELRRLLEGKADEMVLPPAIPEGLHGRVRRRRALSVVVATVVVAALVMGTAGAVSSLRTDDRRGIDPAPELSDLPGKDDFNIWTMSKSGKEVTQLTGSPEDEVQPAWSPTHNLVAFSRIERNGPGHIYISNGDREAQVSFGDTIDEVPAWSPNGKWIAFTRSEVGDYEARIFVVNVEDLYLADGSVNKIDRPARRLVTQAGTATERWPAWSPDGKRIAFVGGDNTVYIVNKDGSGLQPIFEDSDGVERIAWDPTTGNLLLTIHSPYDHLRLFYPNAKQPLGPRLGPSNTAEYLPAWSPDGKLIAFTSPDDGDDEVLVMRSDGTGRRRLTDNRHEDGFPGFSPNGHYIVFMSNR